MPLRLVVHDLAADEGCQRLIVKTLNECCAQIQTLRVSQAVDDSATRRKPQSITACAELLAQGAYEADLDRAVCNRETPCRAAVGGLRERPQSVFLRRLGVHRAVST